jgi:hypothetical protein
MKHLMVLAVAVIAMLGSMTEGRAETRLLWRTPTAGVTITTNSQSTLIQLGQVDVSAYDRLRLVVVARRPTGVSESSGFGAPFRIELRIGEGDEDLGILDNGVFLLNPTSTTGNAPAHTVRATAVFDHPVISRLRIAAVGHTTGNQRTTVDIYVYGQTDSGNSSQ